MAGSDSKQPGCGWAWVPTVQSTELLNYEEKLLWHCLDGTNGSSSLDLVVEAGAADGWSGGDGNWRQVAREVGPVAVSFPFGFRWPDRLSSSAG